MRYSSKRIRELADLKHAAVERIRTDIGQIDTSPSHKYIEEFTTEFANFQDVCDPSMVVDDASAANLIWIGDYHALSRFQEFVSTFLRELFQRNRNIALAVEPVFARHQRTLERWMSGRISEQAFLEAIRYDDEWGCDWKSYSQWFSTARELGIPVYGIDSHPRYDMRSIGRRDISPELSNVIQLGRSSSSLANRTSPRSTFRAGFARFWANEVFPEKKS
jgi:heme-binding uptake protein ChaN (Tiki superfamily)